MAEETPKKTPAKKTPAKPAAKKPAAKATPKNQAKASNGTTIVYH